LQFGWGKSVEAGEQSGFVRVAEERDFRGTQLGRGLARNFSDGLGGMDQQRRGDGTFGDGNDGVGAAGAVAGISLGVKGEADAVAPGPGLGAGTPPR
jgi:hypothetical protein